MQRLILMLAIAQIVSPASADKEWPHIDDRKQDEPGYSDQRSQSDQERNDAYKARLEERRRVALERRYAKYGNKRYNRPPTYFPAAMQPQIATVSRVYLYRPVSSCRPSRRSIALSCYD